LSDRDLLAIQPNFTDNCEICPCGLDHEKLAHRDCVLKHYVRNVEIMGDHHQIRGTAVLQNFLHDALLIQFGLAFRYRTRGPEILNGRRAAKCKHAGVDATAIRARQNLSNCNAVSAEGFSNALGLLYTVRSAG
jgi:hypothetical protein